MALIVIDLINNPEDEGTEDTTTVFPEPEDSNESPSVTVPAVRKQLVTITGEIVDA